MRHLFPILLLSACQSIAPKKDWEFPCPMPADEGLRTIYLIGETHPQSILGTPPALVKKQSWKIRTRILEEARAGHFSVALEGLSYVPNPQERPRDAEEIAEEILFGAPRLKSAPAADPNWFKNVYGLENEFTYSLALLMNQTIFLFSEYSEKLEKKKSLETSRVKFHWHLVRALQISPALWEAFKKIPRPLSDEIEESIAQLLEGQVKNVKDPLELEGFIGKETQESLKHIVMSESYGKLIRRLTLLTFSDKLKEYEFSEQDIAERRKGYSEFLNDKYPDWNQFELMLELFSIHIRNWDWSENSVNIYCSSVMAGKPLLLLMGQKHVEGMRRNFQIASDNQLLIKTELPEEPEAGTENKSLPQRQ
jgi:hypothetical protein